VARLRLRTLPVLQLGPETLCEAQINTGYGMDGGYAEYVAAYERHVVKVPDAWTPWTRRR
jgi:D-arabinose 1-dehydrogenase-like Zn-dependent alcohol dehydrogenase